jgi:hypothetical protein
MRERRKWVVQGFLHEKRVSEPGHSSPEGEEARSGGLLSALAKRLWKPSGAGDALFRFSGQVLFLRGFQPLINRNSGRFLDCLNDLIFFDTAKVVGGGGLPPIGHIEF